MGLSGPHFELINHDDTFYEGWIDSRLILVHKSILVTTQGCIGDNEQGIWFGLIHKLDDLMQLINQFGAILDQIK